MVDLNLMSCRVRCRCGRSHGQFPAARSARFGSFPPHREPRIHNGWYHCMEVDEGGYHWGRLPPPFAGRRPLQAAPAGSQRPLPAARTCLKVVAVCRHE